MTELHWQDPSSEDDSPSAESAGDKWFGVTMALCGFVVGFVLQRFFL